MLDVKIAPRVPEGVVAIGVPVVSGGVGGVGRVGGVGGVGGTSRGEPAPFEWICRLGGLDDASARVAGLLLPDAPDEAWLRRQGFEAASGQSLVLRAAGGGPSVVLLGLGARAGLDAQRWRLAAAALVRAGGSGGGTAALLLPADPPGSDPRALGAAIAEGAVLASYRFDAYRTATTPVGIERLVAVSGSDPSGASDPSGVTEAWADGLRRGAIGASATAFARDLVNTPASDMTPRRLAELVAERLSDRPGTTVEVWDEERITAERLGGVLAVARGSAEPPRLVRATYTPADGGPGGTTDPGRVPHVVLVGKGITFDSGGLSLKSADGMMTMKTDMSGAAIVLSVVSACADLSVPVKVTAIAPLAENMPGGRAQKPGDVCTARNGLTIEVLNTDAEGRLVLADALALAAELSPDAIVDLATLTGAQVVALGTGMAAVLGNDDVLVDRLRASGDRTGERLWPLPLPDDYAEHIESEVADMKNMGRSREAGTIAGAMLLARFVGDVPWAHLDIAGPARSAESSGYLAKGATAFGVRALLDFLSRYGAADGAASPHGATERGTRTHG